MDVKAYVAGGFCLGAEAKLRLRRTNLRQLSNADRGHLGVSRFVAAH